MSDKGFKVNKTRCDTCIFSKRSPITDERFEELKQAWADENIVQECHKYTVEDLQVGCRGHYDTSKRGELPHPVNKIADDMGLSHLSVTTQFQIYERMGLIRFVSIEEETQCQK